MKTLVCIMTLAIILGTGYASATELSVREQALVKTVIAQCLSRRFHVLKQNPDVSQQVREAHPFYIALSNAKDKETQLVALFQNAKNGDRQKLLAAQALAYLGNKTGISVLKEAAFGTQYLSNSGFEISESALCLLYLGYDFPNTFRFSKTPNPLYPDLDILIEK